MPTKNPVKKTSSTARKGRKATTASGRKAAAPAGSRAPVVATSKAATYLPTENEKYMNKRQLVYFHKFLEKMRADILANNERLVDAIKDDVQALPDENDRASKESEFAVELRERERERRLLDKVDSALQRVANKHFGYCNECNDPIGLRRLLARPVATLCIDCKNLQEAFEKSGAITSSNGN